MTDTPLDAAAMVADARRRGSVDLGGLRLDIDPAAETLLVSCAGLNPPGRIVYAHEYTELDRRLSRLFVSDADNHWFLGGVPGVTASIYATIALLGALIAHIHPQRSIAVGTSMGGYLSLLLGCAGLVDEAIAFAPQTTLDPAWREAQGDRRWGPDIDAGIATLAPLPAPDVAAWAAAPGARRARLHLFYPILEREDVAHAQRLEAAGGPLLYPVDTCHHTVSFFLRKKGVLAAVVNEIIAGRTPLAMVLPLRDDADDPERAYRDGVTLLQRHAYREAEEALRRAVAGATPPGHYFGRLAEALFGQGRSDDAMRVVRDAVAAQPNDPHRRLNLAFAARRLHLTDEAEANIRRAMELAPHDYRVAEEACAFLIRQGRRAEAAALARQARRVVHGAHLFGRDLDALLGAGWRDGE